MENLFSALYGALRMIARLAGGYATVIDLRSGAYKTVDATGEEVSHYPLENYEGLEEARECRRPLLVASRREEGVLHFFLPLGDCLLAVNNVLRARREGDLKAIFREALPLIARVAGGEAVLFDRQGIRFFAVDPDGKESDRGMGELTYLGRQAMELGRPVIGPSLLEEGAMAVRIPVTAEFGMGFNNVLAVKQKKMLATTSQRDYARYTFAHIIGTSRAIQHCIRQARQVAVTNSTVLLYGETGTGKELFAQSIHNASQRSGGPFVAINCGAIPASLVESQLFGYEAGAFTGARKEGQSGVFEQANGGTLFLDEISEMELELQSRLLRVLQERELVRIGGKKPIPVDVRVIASTNKDLWQMVASGKFRQDLFYRLNVVDLRIPPLRERVEDIPLLVRHFIKQFRDTFGTFVRDISPEALECLMAYSWPGNVRELQNCIERTMNLATHEVILPSDLPALIRNCSCRLPENTVSGSCAGQISPVPLSGNSSPGEQDRAKDETPFVKTPGSCVLKGTTQAVERSTILRVLEETGYHRRRAAERLGISTTTLWRKMKRLGLLPEKARVSV
ncbi:sigma-54 interaction domain-containing protein [Desulfofundulus thermosubterraneus]|uniref:Regulatory protein, Fis family n=1 Tax=Desulfofundulus thermosubterraneus DSM 16057 TaxID=1121432 RepID=A0A1M6BL96_9FIRM|nr:sigma 54-interacting transcriptional regulator [Desulfofundulus thermosubterraneus]SHI49495.1 regulatory protein, Fis family [Desulfofundulus thermosubterraneus DSM 16057]